MHPSGIGDHRGFPAAADPHVNPAVATNKTSSQRCCNSLPPAVSPAASKPSTFLTHRSSLPPALCPTASHMSPSPGHYRNLPSTAADKSPSYAYGSSLHPALCPAASDMSPCPGNYSNLPPTAVDKSPSHARSRSVIFLSTSGTSPPQARSSLRQAVSSDALSTPPSPADSRRSSSSTAVSSAAAMCAVCQEPLAKARIHYGAVTCYSCRAFFRRATLRGEERVCLQQGTCRVLLKDRKDCTYCRYEKCVEAGMSISLILSEEGKRQRFKRYFEKKDQASAIEQAGTPEHNDRVRSAMNATPRAAVIPVPLAASVTAATDAVGGAQQTAELPAQPTASCEKLRWPPELKKIEGSPPKMSRVSVNSTSHAAVEEQRDLARRSQPPRESVLVNPGPARDSEALERKPRLSAQSEDALEWKPRLSAQSEDALEWKPRLSAQSEDALKRKPRLSAQSKDALERKPRLSAQSEDALTAANILKAMGARHPWLLTSWPPTDGPWALNPARSMTEAQGPPQASPGSSGETDRRSVIQGLKVMRLKNPYGPETTTSESSTFRQVSWNTGGELVAERDHVVAHNLRTRADLMEGIFSSSQSARNQSAEQETWNERAASQSRTPSKSEEDRLSNSWRRHTDGGGLRCLLERKFPISRTYSSWLVPQQRNLFPPAGQHDSWDGHGHQGGQGGDARREIQGIVKLERTEPVERGHLVPSEQALRSSHLERFPPLAPIAQKGQVQVSAGDAIGVENPRLLISTRSEVTPVTDESAVSHLGDDETNNSCSSLLSTAKLHAVINTGNAHQTPFSSQSLGQEPISMQASGLETKPDNEVDLFKPDNIEHISRNISVKRRHQMMQEDNFDMVNVLKYLQYNHKKFRKKLCVDVNDRSSALPAFSNPALPGTEDQLGRSSVIMMRQKKGEAVSLCDLEKVRTQGLKEAAKADSEEVQFDEDKEEGMKSEDVSEEGIENLIKDDQKLLELVYSLDVAQDDQKLLERVYSLDVAQVEGIFTLEEERCVGKQNSDFWENWHSYSVGPELISKWLHFIQHGGAMDPAFYSLVHKQLRIRLITSFFSLQDRSEILLKDIACLLCQNVSLCALLPHVFSYNIKDPITMTTLVALGRKDRQLWEAAGRPEPPSAEDLLGKMMMRPGDKIMMFGLFNSFCFPFLKDPKVFYMMVMISLLNPEGIELIDRSAVVRLRNVYMGMLSRYLAHHYNSPIAERKVHECVAALPWFESFFLKGCPPLEQA